MGCQVTSLGCQVTTINHTENTRESRAGASSHRPGRAPLDRSVACGFPSIVLDVRGSSSRVHTSARCDICRGCSRSRITPKRQSEPFAEPWVMDVVNEHGLIITSSPQALRTSLPTLKTLAALASEHQAEDHTVPCGQPPSTGPTPPNLHTSHSCVHQRCRL